jgi:hypothetical protein
MIVPRGTNGSKLSPMFRCVGFAETSRPRSCGRNGPQPKYTDKMTILINLNKLTTMEVPGGRQKPPDPKRGQDETQQGNKYVNAKPQYQHQCEWNSL